MQDARISIGLPSHPKTKKLIRRIGGDGAYRLVCLFLWTAANKSDGNLSGMSDEDIELAVDWMGDEGAFVQALVEVGFLDGEVDSRVIHDWAEHNPWAAGSEDRSEASKWAALCKRYGRSGAAERMPEYAERKGYPSADAAETTEAHAGRMRGACGAHESAVPEDAPRMRAVEIRSAPSPLPSPSPSLKAEPAIAGLSPAAASPPPDDVADSPGGDGGQPAAPKSVPDRPPCPHDRIIALYHETLPELRRIREWNETRRRLLQRRWAEQPERQDLAWWRRFFEYVRTSKFLMGQTVGRDGRPFDCDLEWLVKPTNFAKVVEGKYEDAAA